MACCGGGRLGGPPGTAGSKSGDKAAASGADERRKGTKRKYIRVVSSPSPARLRNALPRTAHQQELDEARKAEGALLGDIASNRTLFG